VCIDRIRKNKNSSEITFSSHITLNCVLYWLSSSVFEELSFSSQEPFLLLEIEMTKAEVGGQFL